ncbi:MAG: ion transporter [Coriobacteriales bacterium]|nr:ion transporter [Coriobacteriales bacterium]
MWRQQIYSLVHGETTPAFIYNRIMTVVIIISILPLCFKETNDFFAASEIVCTIIFIIDYLLRWMTADLLLGKGKVSFALYPFKPMAIIDLISILPAFVASNSVLKAFRITRLFRALRAFKLVRYSKGMDLVLSVFYKQKQPLLFIVGLALSYVLVSALIVFNVEPDTFDTFFDAVYWAVVSLTTVGYGDLYPTTNIGRFIAMVSSFMGVAVVALPSGVITSGLLDELHNKQDNE